MLERRNLLENLFLTSCVPEATKLIDELRLKTCSGCELGFLNRTGKSNTFLSYYTDPSHLILFDKITIFRARVSNRSEKFPFWLLLPGRCCQNATSEESYRIADWEILHSPLRNGE